MSQPIRNPIAEQVNSFRESTVLPFSDILDSKMVESALAEEGVTFHERIFTPLVTLCAFLSQVLDPDHSCRATVARVIVWMAMQGRKPCSPETNSYCEARQRLPLGLVTRLVRRTAREIDDRAPEAWLWHGRRVTLVDGTTASMPDTPANQGAFPQATSQGVGLGFPLVRMVATISLATGVVRDLALGPYQAKETGETALFRALWDGLERGEIVLGDRCFASFFGIAGLSVRGVDVLFRMHQRRKFDFRRGRQLGVEDHVVTWVKPARPEWMDEATYEALPNEPEMRELRIEVGQPGFRVNELVLVTTMRDADEYAKGEMADLFLKRWNIELDFRSIKAVLQMDVLRCRTPEMVQKEIWMHLLAYNLIRGVTALAAAAHDKRPRLLSFKGTLQTMTAFQDAMRQAKPSERQRLWEMMLEAISHHEVGDRFGRVEPRANKRRPKPQRFLTEPRQQARKRLLEDTL
ncbi:MAG: IS4 family transposase [Actinomycetota bacterium]|nr:IS4 family transposase [Actinomycetota bacterium]